MSAPTPAPRAPMLAAWVLGLIAAVWAGQVRGTLSSNDGSNLALARSLALRHETELGPDAWRTLWVDLAVREGRPYSDRPPGTAFMASPAAWLGDALDPLFVGERASPPWPASSELYRGTAQARAPGAFAKEGVSGTPLAIAIHGIAMGLLGLLAVWALLARLGADPKVRAGTVLGLGVCTAYGAYAPVLFSHVSAAAMTWCALWAALASREGERRANTQAAVAGLAGAMAIACDFALVLAVVPALAVTVKPKRWLWAMGGASIVGVAVAAYHTAAFGSPLSIGYDFSTNFAFARNRSTTFAGDPVSGANILFGWGRGAGLLVRGPIVLLGLVLALAPRRALGDAPNWVRRWALCFAPWLLLLCFHRTPWGGAGADHRYLIPALGLAAMALGTRSWTKLSRAGLAVLAIASGWAFWRGYVSAYEVEPLSSPILSALMVALLCLAIVLIRVRARVRPDAPPAT